MVLQCCILNNFASCSWGVQRYAAQSKVPPPPSGHEILITVLPVGYPLSGLHHGPHNFYEGHGYHYQSLVIVERARSGDHFGQI